MSKAAAGIFSVALLALVASPAFRDPPRDSFPFSDYPMFSHGRPSPLMELDHALGVRRDGSRVPLPPPISSGNAEVLQSMATIRRAVRSGRTRLFCDEVAERVAGSDALRDVIAVEIVTSELDAVAYFDNGGQPLQREVHARCDVGDGR